MTETVEILTKHGQIAPLPESPVVLCPTVRILDLRPPAKPNIPAFVGSGCLFAQRDHDSDLRTDLVTFSHLSLN